MAPKDFDNQIIWLIGASTGIGNALAQELAQRGACLALSARRTMHDDPLLQNPASPHQFFALDVADPQQIKPCLEAILAHYGRLDRVIFLAATYTPMPLTALDLELCQDHFTVNVMGLLHLLPSVLPVLQAQPQRAQLAICASVAGFIGLPGGQPYSASKAALINIAESLSAELGDQLDIKLINPGFVRSPLTDKNTFPMPMIMEPHHAARCIADGLLSHGFEIHFPKPFTLMIKLLRLLPYALSLWITRRIKV